MKLTLPEKNKIRKKDLIIYISIVVICIISVIVSCYVQFHDQIDVTTLVGKAKSKEFGEKTEEQKELLKADFDKIFTNNITGDREEIPKIDETKEIVYTDYEKKESKLNSYDIEVHIPQINIDDENIAKCNKEIQDVFRTKTESILKSENKNVIYTVEYVANVEDNILSLIIRSNLKEGSSAQRVIIQTYNYDLKNNKEITLAEILKNKNIKEQIVQAQIKNTIDLEQKKVKALEELGYTIYSRDSSNDMYKIENTTEFYLTENTLYIIYAYGNETFTSEMDLVII